MNRFKILFGVASLNRDFKAHRFEESLFVGVLQLSTGHKFSNGWAYQDYVPVAENMKELQMIIVYTRALYRLVIPIKP